MTTQLERDHSARRWRRLLLPVITLLVGGSLILWQSYAAPRRLADVHALITTVLAEAHPPRPSMAAIGTTEPVISDMVRQRLAELVAASQAAGIEPAFSLSAGDVPDAGDVATHHAVFVAPDNSRLILRILHTGSGPPTIIGLDLRTPTPPPSQVPHP